MIAVPAPAPRPQPRNQAEAGAVEARRQPVAPLRLAGLTFEQGAHGYAGPGVGVRHAHRRPEALGDEQARHLAAWLLATVGDAPAPADPDAVWTAIDEHVRAGLAWASHALDAVAAAAGASTTRRTRP